MAEKKSASAGTKVRRIKATDDKPKKSAPKKVPSTSKQSTKKQALATSTKPVRRGPLKALSDYFRGAWVELKQVRWPTRSATWGMTLAVLIFTAFFIALIILLDTGFKWVFEQILR